MTQTQTEQLAAMNKMFSDLGARMMWQIPGPKGTLIEHIECYLVGTTLVLVEIFEGGWDYFIRGEKMNFSDIEAELKALYR